MNKLKKSISILLVFLMACVIVPSFNQVKADILVTPPKGTYIQFGHYNGVPIVWRVLDNNANGTLLISDKIITLKPFDAAESGHYNQDNGTYKNDSEKRVQWSGSNRWSNSNIREWLNSDRQTVNYSTYAPTNEAIYNGYNDYDKEAGFLTNFTQDEKSKINEVQNETEVFDIDTEKISQVKDLTNDNVFLLSYNEINNYFSSNSARIANLTTESAQKSEYAVEGGKNMDYWLRSPSPSHSYYVYFVNYSGYIYDFYNLVACSAGVRPALYLKSEISISSGNGTVDSPYIFAGTTANGMPENTVVIGNKAFPIKLLFENNQKVVDAWNNIKKYSSKVFFKQKEKGWIDLNNKNIDKSVIPQVEYTNDDTVTTVTYAAYDGDVIEPSINTDIVTFEDPNLEQIIREKINKPTGDILKSDVENITELISVGKKIKSLKGIENLKNMENLCLSENDLIDISPLKSLINLHLLNLLYNPQLSDISAIKDLTNLTSLYLGGNQISDISALSGLRNLETLYLSSPTNMNYNNKISDLSPIKGLVKLKEFIAYNNQITDISALKDLVNLETLYLNCNKITNINNLNKLTNLKNLELSNNQITDVSAISNLSNLRYLCLYNNQITDINALKNLFDLVELHLYNNQIVNIDALKGLINLEKLSLDNNKIIDINALKGLINLESVNLSNNEISEQQISQLKVALPKCYIYND